MFVFFFLQQKDALKRNPTQTEDACTFWSESTLPLLLIHACTMKFTCSISDLKQGNSPPLKAWSWEEVNAGSLQHRGLLFSVRQSQELPWNPFASKPAPPAGILSHYHFLPGSFQWASRRNAISSHSYIWNESGKQKSAFRATFQLQVKRMQLLWRAQWSSKFFWVFLKK